MKYIKPTEGAYLKHKNGNILLYGKNDAICTITPGWSKYRKEKTEHGSYDKFEAYIPATPEEILWIKACMKVRKFIPFNKISFEQMINNPQYEIY